MGQPLLISTGIFFLWFFVGIAPTLSEEGAPEKEGKSAASTGALLRGGFSFEDLRSGKDFLRAEVRAMQQDRFGNPGMIAVERGALLWSKKEGKAKKSCKTCHNKANYSMVGVGARYPLYERSAKKPIALEQRINLCRTKFMKAKAWSYEAIELVALTTYIKYQSRGFPMTVKIDGLIAPFFEQGRRDYYRKRGQLNMSCAGCHNQNFGKYFGAHHMSQGHSNGFPAYFLSWQKTGSLHRRIESCNRLVRAEPFPYGSDDYINLELYLAWRGRGMRIETPAVRN